ncbi:uncharacterized protein BT62DRAFT_730370 [Guyanagaster necrorhizus]|uniref:Uncharacterized protein n=1 Tax=Guyanagaster necrorhizus TaxID=856835 RepID=A0A9P7VXN0_9AGAR|nr:uncharacterized protein BT62DRAFT_730370 [Guyanagaster necrorhizus MCA 3950]KAG7448839.1 hypothetical protein BT62DRAFT_730370 [Guyanagaster necrorhizus MCA 3950]
MNLFAADGNVQRKHRHIMGPAFNNKLYLTRLLTKGGVILCPLPCPPPNDIQSPLSPNCNYCLRGSSPATTRVWLTAADVLVASSPVGPARRSPRTSCQNDTGDPCEAVGGRLVI